MKTITVALDVNGTRAAVTVQAAARLVDMLRTELGLTGTKVGCDVGECGACTVLVDGAPTLACLVLAAEIDGCAVTTIENTANPRVRALQQAFVAEAGLQCGFCTPGMILAASVLPSDAEAATIRAALVGNLCRCTGYTKIVRAVQRAGRTVQRAGRTVQQAGRTVQQAGRTARRAERASGRTRRTTRTDGDTH